MIIFGFKTRLTKAEADDVIKNACPACKGNLELHDLKQWFTLYFIPIFPFSTVEKYYKCNKCDQSYKKEIKEMLAKNQKQAKGIKENIKTNMVKALAACITYMAKIDGKVSKEEQKEIDNLIKNSPKNKKEIQEVVNHVKKTGDKKYVLKILKEAREFLTAEGVMFIVAMIGRMVLADGKVDKKEEKLMKEFLEVCGIPKSTYKTIIEKIKKSTEKKK